MFGFFKKKVKTESIGSKANDSLARSAEMLHIQLITCSADDKKYRHFIDGIFFTGYACGFFDATLQYSGLRPKEDPQVFGLISLGFLHFFNRDQDEAIAHGRKFLTHQNDRAFDEARTIGGKEYFDFMEGKIKTPNGLAREFHEIRNDLGNSSLHEAMRTLDEIKTLMGLSSEDGVDADELPNSQGEFGITLTNPIPSDTIMGSMIYLESLRTPDGSKISSKRIGSFTSPVTTSPVDGYKITHANGKEITTLYFSPYQKRNSEKAPREFILVSTS